MSALTPDQLERYARHIVLPDIGGAGQVALSRAHILVLGAGGIGAPALQYLAAAGVGTLTLIDDDAVSLSNLQRQLLFATSDIGQPKAEVARERLGAINPDIDIIAIGQRLTAGNAAAFLDGVDCVVDGSDSFATRLAMADACTQARVTLVSAAIARFQGQVGTFRGWRADQPCYRCFVGDAFDADDCDSCAEQGVLGAMCGLIGSFAAMEAIRHVTGFGEDAAGKIHVFDGLKPAMRTLRLAKDPGCRACGVGG